MIKYRTSKYDVKIEAVEATKETAHFVTVKGWHGKEQREAKRSDYTNYFDTWDEAKNYLVERTEGKLNHARRELEKAQGAYGNALGLKNPEAL